jgi:hypothetical protein
VFAIGAADGGDELDSADPGPMPDFLMRKVPADRAPALGPPGDSLDDLE